MTMATLQVRDVPDETIETLKAKAKDLGVSLSVYIRQLLDRAAAQPTAEEVFARIATREPVRISTEETLAVLHEARR